MSRKKLNLIFGAHCHQPVGNFDHVIRNAYRQGYHPFLEVLAAHPGVKAVLHYSGPLYEWIEANDGAFFDRLRSLFRRGQVEILGGGFYEPVFPLIPDADKLGQLRMLTDFIRRRFGGRARGAWLGERVWEPSLPRSLAEAGIEYTVVDENHFKTAGFGREENFGYYVTEEEGKRLFLFATSHRLRYLVPFAGPERIIDYLSALATKAGDRVIVLVDDGERFGAWPGTHRLVYQEKWLERFFRLLESNRHWLNLLTFSEYVDRHPPRGRVYLPSSAYPEMTEWSGGYFRNFLVKYPESNNMHKRMLEVSERLQALDAAGEDDEQLTRARRELYRGQCNCAYWHGIFGGLYLSHLRAGVYRHLIGAEKILDEREGKTSGVYRRETDFDRDGKDEIIVGNSRMKFYLDPAEGGTLFELDYRPKNANLVNTMSRVREEYHRQFAPKFFGGWDKFSMAGSIYQFLGMKDKQLTRYLRYDSYRRVCLVDHFLGAGTTATRFARGSYRELGDFVGQPYDWFWRDPAPAGSDFGKGRRTAPAEDGLRLFLRRNGTVVSGRMKNPVRVIKSLTVPAGSAEAVFGYQVENTGGREVKLHFAVEFNLAVEDPALAGIGGMKKVNGLIIQDRWCGLKADYRLSEETELWHFPVEAVSESECGLEKTYQQLCLVFNWQLSLKAGEDWRVEISQCLHPGRVEPMPAAKETAEVLLLSSPGGKGGVFNF